MRIQNISFSYKIAFVTHLRMGVLWHHKDVESSAIYHTWLASSTNITNIAASIRTNNGDLPNHGKTTRLLHTWANPMMTTQEIAHCCANRCTDVFYANSHPDLSRKHMPTAHTSIETSQTEEASSTATDPTRRYQERFWKSAYCT